jgi:hypothetical protein
MRILRRFYVIVSTLIMVVSALLKLAVGASMMSGSAWIAVQSGDMTVIVIMAIFFVWGFVIFVRALGPLVGENKPPGRRA